MSRLTLHEVGTPGGPSQAGVRQVRDLGRVLLALVVIAVGGLYLLEAGGALDAGSTIDDWWPLLLVAVGLVQFAERSHGSVEPVLWIAAGVVLLGFSTDVLGEDAWSWVWPAALVVAGGYVLLKWAGLASRAHPRTSGNALVASGILGGHTVISTSPAFEGASLTAVLGGVDLDLRQARLAAAGATLTATAVLGGIEILVPPDWRVSVSGTPILGGIEDARDQRAEGADEAAPVLSIDAMAILGGVEIRNTPKGR